MSFHCHLLLMSVVFGRNLMATFSSAITCFTSERYNRHYIIQAVLAVAVKQSRKFCIKQKLQSVSSTKSRPQIQEIRFVECVLNAMNSNFKPVGV